MSDNAIQSIVIVGGGSAGWLTAGLIASEYNDAAGSSVSVTLIESPDVKTIGVGEGTWPTMRSTLQKIGLSEADFLQCCSASFKQGTRFAGWVTGGRDDTYYHPFSAPAGYVDINLATHWQSQSDQVSFANAVCAQGYICDRNLAPKQAATPDYASVVNYAYHLDAGKFAELLQNHCINKLGVRHLLDHVTGINGNPDEDIRSLTTAKNGDLEGDLFIDCSGMTSLLLGQHFQIPFVDRKAVLFNDTAIAAQVSYADQNGPVASQTISTARDAGWIWDIGLSNRRGVGYTYSSAHSSDDDAEGSLRSYIESSENVGALVSEPRKISFRPGHREKFWHRNVVAIGMSAGFLEPLEASALVLVELAGQMINEELPANRAVMDIVADRYNEKFLYRWDRIIDFLKLHYVLSQRNGEAYWSDNRGAASIPDSLQNMLELWQHHVPWHNDFPQRDEIFSSASYQYVLYGMGYRTKLRSSARLKQESARAYQLFAANTEKTNSLIGGLPTNRELLDSISGRGFPAS